MIPPFFICTPHTVIKTESPTPHIDKMLELALVV